MPNYRIEKLQLSDIGEIFAIEQVASAYPWSQKMLRDSLAAGAQCFGVRDKVLCGYVLFSGVTDNTEILTIAVHPDHQQKGYGQALLQAVIQSAKDQHCKRILLDVRKSNKPAIGLYKKLGFVQDGVRKNYYRSAGIPKVFQVAARRTRSRAAECTVQSLSSEASVQQSDRGLMREAHPQAPPSSAKAGDPEINLKDEGYREDALLFSLVISATI